MTPSHTRHWTDDRDSADDEEARSRLLDAAERCIVDRGDTQIRMTAVASDAGVARSTLYRYYASRDDLLLGLVLRRIDNAFNRWVHSLRRPRDAARSIRELVLKPVAAVSDDDPLNHALYANETSVLVPVLEAGTQSVVDVMAEHVSPLFKQWKADGQIYADLDLRETMQWMSATTSFLLTTDWRHRPVAAKRRFVDRYLIRALVP
ncbi:TetR/AcrR family transcriptional regulator [Mycobacterium sp. TNTM28]|uniref:TetR/AcrR family transcriptional regulator n=1 Tax=[Mycobacterium] fortunisiensis TaxID=2600579 RepID=A0ABS6KIL5_9MYCO|nr:TetR/AcrR family transcriptional regulator [[Mycobacterium] fortunisiensis]MBU9763449.1 TetR/AcrR family transcriptional regulator [[Mycobacterium] fortunisiensis]